MAQNRGVWRRIRDSIRKTPSRRKVSFASEDDARSALVKLVLKKINEDKEKKVSQLRDRRTVRGRAKQWVSKTVASFSPMTLKQWHTILEGQNANLLGELDEMKRARSTKEISQIIMGKIAPRLQKLEQTVVHFSFRKAMRTIPIKDKNERNALWEIMNGMTIHVNWNAGRKGIVLNNFKPSLKKILGKRYFVFSFFFNQAMRKGIDSINEESIIPIQIETAKILHGIRQG